jgi:RHS repeat-associated protein
VSGSALDANGNTLTDASGKNYTWDFENRLVSAVVPGTGTVAFKYDTFGRRIQKSSALGTTNYLYDGINSIEEVDQSGNVLARYARTTSIDEPLSEVRSGTAGYYDQDGLGSISSLSNSAGALADTYTYDSFGKLVASTGTLTSPFQYTGREFDPEAGLNYNSARYYNPTTGRFISQDPLGFGGGNPNVYEYVGNNSLNFIDPIGLTSCVVTSTVGVVCSNWNTNWSWTEPQGPQPPPSDLTPNPPSTPPPVNQCSCANYMQAEFEEIDSRSWHAVMRSIGISSGTKAAEYWGPHWLEQYLPLAEGGDLLYLEYELWEIQEQVSAKYEHCKR